MSRTRLDPSGAATYAPPLMCGIGVILDLGSGTEPLLTALARLHNALAHRGPDGEGILLLREQSDSADRYPSLEVAKRGANRGPIRLGAAFRRLAIQDRSDAAAQPVAAPDAPDRAWILFNGELYNHAELRRELAVRGVVPRSANDAEVALAAWRAWGPDAVRRMNGMFAFVILDLDRAELVGARDRLGIKPLFWSVEGQRLVVASEPQAVACAQAVRPQPDADQLATFLAGLPPLVAQASFYANVRPFPAAATFRIPLEGRTATPVVTPYWSLPAAGRVPSFDDAVDELRALLVDAVALQDSGDVPVGCMLSGGLDSSLLTGLVAATRPVHAFSAVHDDPTLNEAPWQWAVVARGNVTHHRLTLTAPLVAAAADDAIDALGQPLLGFDVAAQFAMYRFARAHGFPVVLDGQGSDELLAGERAFVQPWLRQLLRSRRLVETWREALAFGGTAGAAVRLLAAAARAASPRRLAPLPFLDDRPAHHAAAQWSFSADDLAQFQRTLVTVTNLPVVLDMQDRSTMANGVESRVPYLDHRIVEFCDRLPGEYRLHRGVRKRILREAAKGFVPDVILARREKGALISRQQYLDVRTTHAARLDELANAPLWHDLPWVRGQAVRPFVLDYVAGRHDDALAVWRLYTAWRWLSHPRFTA